MVASPGREGEDSMIPIRHVVCPTDFSTFSERSLRYAVLFAKWFGADLTVLFVLAGRRTPPDADSPWGSDTVIEPAARERLRARLEAFATPARAAMLDVKTELREGAVVATILAEARRIPDALVVLGTHGLGGFENLVLGSVTEKVLRMAPCPVLTVPREPERSAASAVPFGTVLCPVDFSASSQAALAAAAGLAATAGAALVAVHVLRELPETEAAGMVHFNVPEYRRLLEKEAADRLRDFVRTNASEAAADARILCGKPYRRILHLAHEIVADLIVMGVQGRSAADLLLFGSTAHHVVRAAPCPVLTVRGA